jgi:O-antigen/teichoic acid export membrane protein
MLAWAAVLVALGRHTEATVVAACAPLVMLLYPFAGVFAFLQGKGRFGDYTVANLAVEGGRTAILALAVVVLGIDGAGAILVLFGSMGVFYLIVHLVHSRGLQGQAGPGFVTMGRNLTGTAALATVAGQMDRLLVGTFFPPAAMAVYNLGFTLTDPLRSFGALGAKLLFPQVVRADASAPRFVRKYGLGLLILAGALAALVGLYWVLFPLIQPWLFPGYEGAVAITNWLIVASALSIFTTVESQALWGLSDLRAVYSARIVLPVLRLVLLLVGGYGFGVPGILAAQVLHPALAALIIGGFWLVALYRRTR